MKVRQRDCDLSAMRLRYVVDLCASVRCSQLSRSTTTKAKVTTPLFLEHLEEKEVGENLDVST